jgi:hypothetical protein
VTINFTIIPLLDGKNKVDSPTFEGLIIKTEIPGANLEKMKDVLWHVLDLFVHQLIHGLHLPVSISILLHETFLFENVNVEKLVFSGVFFERFGDPFVAVTYQNDYKLLLTQFDIGIHVHGIVILEDTANGGFELLDLFVIHCDANSDLWELISQHGQLLHSAEHASGLDLPVYTIRSKTSWSDARVQLGASQGDGLE